MNSQIVLRPTSSDLLTPAGFEQGYGDTGAEFDLRHVLSAIYRNRHVVIATIGLALIVGLAVTILSPRIYSGEASVQIEQQTNDVLGTDSQSQTVVGGTDSDRFLQTQVDIIKSRAVAGRVAENLGFYANDNFIFAMNGKAGASDKGALKPETRRKIVIDLLMGNLEVSLPHDSRIAELAFRSPDPYLSQKVANAYAQSYINANLQRRFDATSYARSFLEQQLALAKDRLERSERATIAYARRAGLLDTNGGMSNTAAPNGGDSGNGSITTSDLLQVNNAYVAAQSARIDAEQRWRQAQITPLLSLPDVLSSPAIQGLMQQKATLQATYEQDLQRRKPAFPTMTQNLAQIKALGDQIDLLAENVRNGIRNQYETALKQERSLAQSVGKLKGATLSEQDLSVQYNILKRETDTNRSMYDALLQRYKEVSAQAGVTVNNITILDNAALPDNPVRPRPFINMAIALLVGCLLSAIIIFIRERFDDAIRSPEDVSQKLRLPFLSSVPLLSGSQSPFEALEDPRSPFSEAYYSLRASLRLLSSAGVPRSLLFTSGRASEGKSTTSFAIARGFSQIGQRVLLIDGDLRKPSLHRLFGASNESGLANVLARQQTIASVVKDIGIPNLDFVPAGPLPPSPTLLLSGPALGELIQTATKEYDLVIIDGPPVLGIADAILYAVAVEASVFIVEAGRNNHGAGRAALRRLLASGANVIGSVLTKFNAKDVGYGYGYGNDYATYYGYGTPGSRPALEE